jgi:hypothetical protein
VAAGGGSVSERAPYSRVYWSIIDDPKFAYVYDDDRALASWLRLLIIADQAWPASASIPYTADKRAVQKLVDVELIDLQPNGRYRIHGLDKERGERRSAATRLRTGRDPSGTQLGTGRDPDAADIPGRRRDELRRDETSPAPAREGLPNLNGTVAGIWETATGRSVLASGNHVAEYLDDACRRHPASEVGAAIIRARKKFDHIPDGPALVSAMRPILDPFPDAKAAKKRDQDEAEKVRRRRALEETKRGMHYAHTSPDPACPACREAA